MRGLVNAIMAFIVFIGIVLGFLYFLGQKNETNSHTAATPKATVVSNDDAEKALADGSITEVALPEIDDGEEDELATLAGELTADELFGESGDTSAEMADSDAMMKDDADNMVSKDADVEMTKEDTDVAMVKPAATQSSYGPISKTTDRYTVNIDVPEGLDARAPKVAASLMEISKAELADFKLTADGNNTSRPYELQTNWTITGEAGDLVALRKDTVVDSGGAHTNSYTSSRTFLKTTGGILTVDRLFKGDSLSVGLFLNEVRNRITQQKLQRLTGASPETIRGEVADLISENGSWIGNIALVASDQPGKIGGLDFMFSTYEIGSFAEGSYDAVVPQSVFAHALKPEYANLFAGQPCWKDESRGLVHPAPCPR